MQKTKDDILKDIIRQFIYKGYATKEFEKYQKTWLFRTLSPQEHDDIVIFVNASYEDKYARQRIYEKEILTKALIAINGIHIEHDKKSDLFHKLSEAVFREIYEEYHKLEELQIEALLREDIIKDFAKPSFDRIKFLVMQEVKALPTEQRVKDMNDYQWLWFWYNMQEKRKEDEELEKVKRDYMCMFINPELYKRIKEHKGMDTAKPSTGSSLQPTSEIIYGDTISDDDFDKKLQHMMQGDTDGFVELPSSDEAGNADEAPDAFFKRVMQNQAYVDQQNQHTKQAKEQRPLQEEDFDMIIPVE